jgi:hypothetical protein
VEGVYESVKRVYELLKEVDEPVKEVPSYVVVPICMREGIIDPIPS